MAWNQPGGGGDNNQDPWGGKKNQGPPDIDKLIAQFFQKLRAFFSNTLGIKVNWRPSPQEEWGMGAGLIAGVIFVLWVIAGFFIVNPAEEAVILRFGRYVDTQQPGLHWMARFIETKYLIDVQKINSFSLQGDFLTKSAEQGDLPNQVQLDATKKEADSSDKSKNLVNVELTVQYRVKDPRAYLFSVVDPDSTIQQVASGALSDIVGQMKLDDVLTTGREFLSSNILERMKQVLKMYNTGLDVVAVTLRKAQAPVKLDKHSVM